MRLRADRRPRDVVTGDGLCQSHAVGALHGPVHQAGGFEFAEDAQDAAGAVDVLDMVMRAGSDFANAWDPARNGIDILHAEGDPRLMGDGQNVQHGIG